MLRSWNDFGVSIFSIMTEEANKAGAINLAQGFPDFDGPAEVIQEAVAALKNGFNQYSPSSGLRDLRLSIGHYVERRRNLKYDPDTQISIFSGATEALFCAVMACCKDKDELLTFEPFFDIYPGFAFAAGASFKTIMLNAPHWDFDASILEKAICPKTRVILLNTPNNPTGKVFSSEELQQIAALAIKHDLIVITDEVYEEVVFEPNEHVCIAQLPAMKERTIVISSASKTFSLTGWKVGYALGPEKLITQLRKIHEHIVFCAATPLQKAAIKAYYLPDCYFDKLRSDYKQKKEFLLKALVNAGFRCFDPQGSYFIIADYSALSDLNDLDFSLWLTREIKLACIPLSAFFQDKEMMSSKHLVRFCFAKTFDTLMASAERLQNLRKLSEKK